MTLLWIGLAVFFGGHLVAATPLRATLVSTLGARGYRAAFSLVSLAGLIVIVLGYRQAPVEMVFAPQPAARAAALHAMPVAFILLAAAHMPTHLRAWLRHPMMIGVGLWAVLHYFANGERAAVWLFGSFAIYAVVSIVSSTLRGKTLINPARPPAWKYDAMAIGGGIVLYLVVLLSHGWLFNRVLVVF
jgi:uncharacterized membrane protein